VRIHGYVLKLKGVHKLKSLGSTDTNDVCCSFISIWQIFFGKCFVRFPTYFHSLKSFSVFSCTKNGLSLSHVSVFYSLEYIFILFVFPKTKLQIVVENRYRLTSIVNSSTGINPLNATLNPTCPLLALFGAHHILHISS